MTNLIYTHIISLERARERRIHCEHLCKYNRTFRIFDAVDYQKKNEFTELKQKYKVLRGGGGAACALSHIAILHQFLQGSNKYVTILEDDCVIKRRLPVNVHEVELMIRRIGIRNPAMVDVLYLSNRVKCNRRYQITNGCGTEGYIFSRLGAMKALSVLENMTLPIDIVLQSHYPDCKYLRDTNDSNKKQIRINAYKTKNVLVECNDHNVSYVNGA